MVDGTGQHWVTTLELFFDLVFVFTLTNLTGHLENELSVESVVQVFLIFVFLIFAACSGCSGGYAWLTNELPPDTDARRLLLFAGMGSFLICSLTIPGAFADQGLAFGTGFLCVVAVHAGRYAQVVGHGVIRFAA